MESIQILTVRTFQICFSAIKKCFEVLAKNKLKLARSKLKSLFETFNEVYNKNKYFTEIIE